MNDGGPAFGGWGIDEELKKTLIEARKKDLPFSLQDIQKVCRHNTGVTVRDYFAAKALEGLLAMSNVTRQVSLEDTVKSLAVQSYMLADAMMKARQEAK